MTAAIPEKIGKYEIQKLVGKGSMGLVYQGYDPFSDQVVAVKLALVESLRDKETGERYRKMFFNEAHAAGVLQHPNIVSILDAGIDEDDCYIVMELIDGAETLKVHCQPDNLLPIDKAVDIIFKCARALDYAHRKGVVHRDIKPTNILLTRDMDIKIADFSIAQIIAPDTTHTMPTGFVGSPRYMSPEQVQEDEITNQTDLFSLGIVMYELITGRHPYTAESFSRLIYKIINEKHPPLKTYRPDVPQILEKIVRHSLEKTAAKRYKMGLNMAADLSLTFEHLKDTRKYIDQEEKFNTVRKLAFFQHFSVPEVWEVINACIWQDFDARADIIIEGDIDDSFYIIASGAVEVQKGGKAIGLLHEGDCFGEMGYLSKTERSATITAKEPVQLMKIHATLIEQASIECQLHFSKAFLRTLVRRLSVTTAAMLSPI